MKIEVGTILIATDPCILMKNGLPSLIIDKEYPVKVVGTQCLVIDSEDKDGDHLFDLSPDDEAYWGKFFYIKDSEQPDLSEPLKLAQHQRYTALVNAFSTIEAFAVPSYTPLYEGYDKFRNYLLEMYNPNK